MDPLPALYVRRLHPDAELPSRETLGAAGYDLKLIEGAEIAPGRSELFRTGLSLRIPPGHYGRLAMRSGAARRTGLLVNAGVIDEDFRSEIRVLLTNPTHAHVRVERGARLVQIILERISTLPVHELSPVEDHHTTRQGHGFEE